MSIQRLLRHIRNSFLNLGRILTQGFSRFIQRGLRSLFRVGRQRQAGFVLPTVTMVMLVVSLLTLAMLLRSTDRAKNAHNFRVNEATLNATAPALDRAKAKIAAIFEDPNIPRGTPSDTAFMGAFGDLGSGIEKYTFGDEVPLKLVFDIDNDGNTGEADSGATKNTKNDETVNTAWKFPIDTDNNGKFDSYTLYTILYRNPTTSGGDFDRARNPLESRNLPMEGASSSACANSAGGGASLVGDSDWFKLPNEQKLKKAFFVYAATVPIGPNASGTLPTDLDPNEYELFPGGTQGFSALEYQQDWSRIPLANNAVVYQDDLLTFAGSDQFFNGRIMTNSNLMVGKGNRSFLTPFKTKFFLVSSKNSCFYDAESSKITVGGNVGNNRYDEFNGDGTLPVDAIDLFQGEGNEPTTDTEFGAAETVTADTTSAKESLYNNNAYSQRISYLVNAAMQRGTGAYPDELLAGRPASDVSEQEAKDYYTKYFRKLTRQIPYIEVPSGDNALFIPTISSGTGIDSDGYLESVDTESKATDFFLLSHSSDPDTSGLNPLRPPHQWMFPVDPTNNATSYMVSEDGSSSLGLELTQIAATNPEELDGTEKRIGDRVLVGNNLPETIYDSDSGILLSGSQARQNLTQDGNEVKWLNLDDNDPSDVQRTRQSQIVTLPDLGDLSRDGQWEIDAATAPNDKFDNVGGLRIVTSAGIYLPGDADANVPLESDFTPENTVIWPDYFPTVRDNDKVVFDNDNDVTTQPIAVNSTAGDDDTNIVRPYLHARGTVVYHHTDTAFADNGYKEDESGSRTHQTPIGCINTYYDPNYNLTDTENDDNGKSYTWKGTLESTYERILKYQAALRYPEVVYDHDSDDSTDPVGDRLVNPLLASGLDKDEDQRTIAEQTAVDAAVCALDILKGHNQSNTSVIPDDTIEEVAFLDARQIKANDIHSLEIQSSTGTNPVVYTLKNEMAEPYFEEGDLVTIEAYDQTTGMNIPKIVRGKVTQNASSTEIRVSTDNDEAVYINPDGVGIDETTEIGWITESLNSRYDLPIEERYPLEIRATKIDLGKLKETERGNSTDPQEYLMPNSGIVYATREDALPDQTVWVKDGAESFKHDSDSAPDLPQSSTDFKLDPTRRPNAILLTNGSALNRGTTNEYRPEEKGFILATDLPVYIQGNFNLHGSSNDIEEFTEDLSLDTYANFYDRSTLDPSFACRKDQPGCDGDGDTWRSATVFADALTLLSDNFQFGVRSDGDYDLNNNRGDARSIAKRRQNGFYTNGFVSNRNYTYEYHNEYTNPDNANDSTLEERFSSYFNNAVTPIQRREEFPEYVMEICEKLPVSECEPDDWRIIYDANGDGNDDYTFNNLGDPDDPPPPLVAGDLKFNLGADSGTISITAIEDINETQLDLNGDRKIEDLEEGDDIEQYVYADFQGNGNLSNLVEKDVPLKASDLPFLVRYDGSDWKKLESDYLLSGTTAKPVTNDDYKSYPRRVAFLRQPDNSLYLESGTPVALGIYSGVIGCYSYQGNNPLDLTAHEIGTYYTSLIAKQDFSSLPELNLNGGVPTEAGNALWFRTTKTPANPENKGGWIYSKQMPLAYLEDLTGYTTEQPLLIPLLQIQTTDNSPRTDDRDNKTVGRTNNTNARETDWVQHAKATSFNLVFVAGDTPGRPDELNRSIGNFPRFIESWQRNSSNQKDARISGSFIQKGRSVYATAPTDSVLTPDIDGIYNETTGLFNVPQNYPSSARGVLPFYDSPGRPWGFDVALLTQAPDLFAQRFAIKDDTPPNEFYREVKRDDEWVQTLLCAAQPDKRVDPADPTQTVDQEGGYEDAGDPYDKDVTITENDTAVNYQFAISADQRPTCPGEE